MFKEIGDRLQNGTMNLSITQKDGLMSVIVGFKGVPGLNEALFTGTPEEIEAEFIERLEQPMKAISKFNFDMDVFNSAIEKELKAKKEKLDAEKKAADAKKSAADKKKKDKEAAEKTQAALPLEAPAKEEEKTEDPNEKVHEELTKETQAEKENEVSRILMTDKQKDDVIEAGLNANSTDHHAKAIAKIKFIKDCNDATAEAYFENNLKARLDEELAHRANVEKMKQEAAPETVAETKEVEEFDPFADDFQL